jgi:hypothetical protein
MVNLGLVVVWLLLAWALVKRNRRLAAQAEMQSGAPGG